MMSFILSAAFIFMILSLPLMSQPLSVGFMLLMSTLMASILSGYFSSSWYAYMIFIVFVGGLLVMFACAFIINYHYGMCLFL